MKTETISVESDALTFRQVVGAWLRTYVGVATLLGTSLLALGAVVTADGGKTNIFAGTILVGLGSIVFSGDAFQAIGRQREADRTRPLIESSVRQVVALSNHLFDIVENSDFVDPRTNAVLVGQLADQLAGVSYDLEQACGSRLPIEIINTIRKENKELDRKTRQVKEREQAGVISAREAQIAIANIRQQRGSSAPQSSPPRIRVREEVPCPNCATDTEIRIGEASGDSATGVCPNPACGLRFHAHRNATGEVFTRLWGGKSAPLQPAVTVACPCCGADIPYHSRGGEITIERYCFECKNRVVIDVDENEAVRYEESSPIPGSSSTLNGRLQITCSGCSETAPSIWKDLHGTAMRPCIKCDRLVVVGQSSSQDPIRDSTE